MKKRKVLLTKLTKTDELIKLLSETIAFTGKTFLLYRGFYIYMGLVKPSIFFYIIKNDEVHILRVLREEQDWNYLMTRDIEYHY